MNFEFKTVVRSLLKAPFFTAAVVFILGFGFGVTASLYRAIKDTFFYYRGYERPGLVARISLKAPTNPNPTYVFLPKFLAYRESSKTIAELAGASGRFENLLINNQPTSVSLCEVTANYFKMLGVRPVLGRGFVPEEGTEGKNRVAILTHAFWQTHLGGAASALGEKIEVNGAAFTVVGVLSSDFNPPLGAVTGQVYIPVVLPNVAVKYDFFTSLSTLARIRDGVTLEQVQAELATIQPEKYTDSERFVGPYAPVVTALDSPSPFASIRRFTIMQRSSVAATAILFGVAVINAGGLMLVRMLKRRRELAIRLALGGGRATVFRPLFFEATLLTGAAVVAGAFASRWLMPFLLAPGGNRTVLPLQGTTLVFLGLLALATCCLLAGVVSWALGRIELNDTLKSGGASSDSLRSKSLRKFVMVIEVALTTCLLIGTALMLLSFQRLQNVTLGYNPDRLYAGRIDPKPLTTLAQQFRQAKLRQLEENIRELPAIESAAIATAGAVGEFFAPQKVSRAGENRRDEATLQAHTVAATPAFLGTLGVPILRGSLERLRDGVAQVVVINESLATALFGESDPIGHWVSVMPNEKLEIVAVVGNVRTSRNEARPTLYVSEALRGSWTTTFYLRTKTDSPSGLVEDVRRALYKFDPNLVIQDFRSQQQIAAEEVSFERRVFSLFLVTAGFALILTATGVIALVGYSVAQRSREIGVRLALGATPRQLTWFLFRDSLNVVLIGIAGGLLLSAYLAKLMEALLYQVTPHDITAYGGAVAILFLITVPACGIPAWFASQLNPTDALKGE